MTIYKQGKRKILTNFQWLSVVFTLMSAMIFVITMVKMLLTHEAQPSESTTNVYLFFYHNIGVK